MSDAIIKAKDTCPSCASKLKNGTANSDGVNIEIKHCECCLWWG